MFSELINSARPTSHHNTQSNFEKANRTNLQKNASPSRSGRNAKLQSSYVWRKSCSDSDLSRLEDNSGNCDRLKKSEKVSTSTTSVVRQVPPCSGNFSDSQSLGSQILPSMSQSLQEKMRSTQKQIAALKQQISERSKSLSPVKTPSNRKPNNDKNDKSGVESVSNEQRKLQMTSTSNVTSGKGKCISNVTGSLIQQQKTTAKSDEIQEKKSQSSIISTSKTPSRYVKKTKYSIVKRCPKTSDVERCSLCDSGSTVKTVSETKPVSENPKRFINLSKYALKRIRRSMSDETNTKSAYMSYQSPVQQVAKTVRTKYKMKKVCYSSGKQWNKCNRTAWQQHGSWGSKWTGGKRSYDPLYIKPSWSRPWDSVKVLKPYRSKRKGRVPSSSLSDADVKLQPKCIICT